MFSRLFQLPLLLLVSLLLSHAIRSLPVSTDFGTWSYQCSFIIIIIISQGCKLPHHIRSYFTLVNKLLDNVTCLLQTGIELILHPIWYFELELVPDGPLRHCHCGYVS
jgi:predicted permease